MIVITESPALLAANGVFCWAAVIVGNQGQGVSCRACLHTRASTGCRAVTIGRHPGQSSFGLTNGMELRFINEILTPRVVSFTG